MIERTRNASLKLAGKGLGHDKFLRFLTVKMTIKAPRNFWQEFATYKFAESQSQSTMHTLTKNPILTDQFLNPAPSAKRITRALFWVVIKIVEHIRKHDVENLRGFLPESYCQIRVISLNYACINNILLQRYNHTLKVFGRYIWREICVQMYEQLEHPELLSVEMVDGKLQRKKI